MKSCLSDDLFGGMAMDAEAVNFLEEKIRKMKPNLIIEFGSGVSTLCLARFMYELHGDNFKLRVISIDQSEEFAIATELLLKKAQLEKVAKVVAVPLRLQDVGGVKASCYDFDLLEKSTIFNYGKADFVLIDGPFADENLTRYGVIPKIRSMVHSNTHFFLDDALRDKELMVANLWRKLPYVKVFGVHFMSKGLLCGKFT